VPSSVRNLSVVKYNKDYVDLSWQCAQTDGGSPIVQYIVEKCDVTSVVGAVFRVCGTVAGSELSIRVAELVEGNSYLFRVSAKNRVGRGPPAMLTEPVVARLPIGMSYYFCYINTSFKFKAMV